MSYNRAGLQDRGQLAEDKRRHTAQVSSMMSMATCCWTGGKSANQDFPNVWVTPSRRLFFACGCDVAFTF